VIPESEDAMSGGSATTLRDDALHARARPDRSKLARLARCWLGAHGLTVPTIGSWAFIRAARASWRVGEHSGSIAGAGDLSLGLTEFGNMSSPTILFILERMRRTRASRPWVALGFDGPRGRGALAGVMSAIDGQRSEAPVRRNVRGFRTTCWRLSLPSQYHGGADEDPLDCRKPEWIRRLTKNPFGFCSILLSNFIPLTMDQQYKLATLHPHRFTRAA